MITRIFRVKVPAHLHQEFEREFLSVSVPFVKTEKGIVSVSVGRPTRWHPDEYVMVSVWENEAALVAFAGEQWNQAVIPKGMEKFISECWVHHYENFGA
jgi:heme-degrading monooxygenase HmoA